MSTVLAGETATTWFGYMQLYYKLRLQVQGPAGMRWRVPPSVTIRHLIGSKTRNNKKLLAEYEQWLKDQGFWQGDDKPQRRRR